MTAAAVRRPGRLPRLVAAAATVASTLLATAVATPARADFTPSPTPSSSATPSLPLTVTLTAVGPRAPQPGQTFSLRGRLRNDSLETVTALQVRLVVSRTHVPTRGQFDDYAHDPAGDPPAGATTASTADVTVGRASLPTGATTRFTVAVPVDDLDLPATWQVYELAVVVDGTTSAGTGTVGQLRTFLPWAPVGQPGTGAPTPVAWVWPLVDRPHRTTATEWADDDLAGELRTGGRLSTLLTTAASAATQHPPPPPRRPRGRHHRKTPPPPPRPTITPVPVTWAIDPLLVQDVQAMAAGYRVGTGENPKPGAGQSTARGWFAELKSAVAGGSVLGLPYADPDVVAANRAGLTGETQLATTIGQQLLSRALQTPTLPYAWPVGGFADQRTLDTLFAGGVTTVVLDASALPVVGGDESLTPDAHATVTTRDGFEPLNAVLADHELSTAVDAAADDPSTSALATQRVLSELLMIQAERPGIPRSVVIAPDRRWDPTPALARNLLAGSGRVPWVSPVTVGEVAGGRVSDLVQRSPEVTYPAEARAAELHRSYLRSILPLKNRADAFAQVVVPTGDPRARQFDDGLLCLLSSAWRAEPALAIEHRELVGRALGETMDQVRIATQPNSQVTLTGNSGTVPVTVSNDLDTPVRIAVVAKADPHLEVRRGAHVVREIPANTRLPVDVRVAARTRGVFTLNVSLFTPGAESRRYSAAVPLQIKSTAYGIEALIITGGATVVLFIGAGIRLARRIRAARRSVRAGA